ncbi:hypothetical protein Pfo_025261 [Paulownia fortunei]|nr:hypothetical protein Pfo_025261 [Paulownia fortunei]
MKGLWSEHFPAAEKPPAPAPAPLARYQRCLICPSCNAASCRLFTSSTPKNPGRQFYKCPSLDHKFFKWADEVKPDEFIDVPYCGGCMAGVCRVRKETSGPNAGRILFMCRVKEGEGSCGFRVWQDELEVSAVGRADEEVTSFQSTTINCDDTRPANADLVEESKQSDEGADNESPVIDTSQHLQCLGVTSGKTEQLKCQEDKPNESSRRPHKRSRYGDLKDPGSLASAHSLTIRLAMNSVSIEHCWMAAAIRQNLSTQLQGWWGRLAFHPMPGLMTHASKPFTCYVSSTSDSTFVVQDKILVNSGDSTTLTRSLLEVENYSKPQCNPGHKAELSSIIPFLVALDVPSCSDHFNETRIHNFMSKSISKAFGQAAEHLQNDLLTLLETMDVKDHEAMSQEAEATFAALDRLLFDNQDFKERAKELIHCATSLAEIEQSMPRNDSYQKFVDHCSSERMRLDEINGFHAKAVDTVTNNKKCLKVLQEEISSTMDWLFQIEAELSCCEAEMRNMEDELEQISEAKEVLEGNYMIASKELEETQKLREQKEMERNAAKAAFDRARALLRG